MNIVSSSVNNTFELSVYIFLQAYDYVHSLLLSCSGLKDLITPVLAGLLESDVSKMLSFERFFATIENISKMRVSNNTILL